jgi:hypothetical protein
MPNAVKFTRMWTGYTPPTHPRLTDARHLKEVSYPVMQEMSAAGAKVLNAQAVQFAKEKQIAIYARSTFRPATRNGGEEIPAGQGGRGSGGGQRIGDHTGSLHRRPEALTGFNWALDVSGDRSRCR